MHYSHYFRLISRYIVKTVQNRPKVTAADHNRFCLVFAKYRSPAMPKLGRARLRPIGSIRSRSVRVGSDKLSDVERRDARAYSFFFWRTYVGCLYCLTDSDQIRQVTRVGRGVIVAVEYAPYQVAGTQSCPSYREPHRAYS